MDEGRTDLSGRTVRLPSGVEFEFAFEIGGYPANRETLERCGVGRGPFDATVDDIVALADVIRDCGRLNVSEFPTRVLMLWHLYYRLDCLLHAFTVRARHDDPDFGGNLADRALMSIFEFDSGIAAAEETGRFDDGSGPLDGLLRALMGDDD